MEEIRSAGDLPASAPGHPYQWVIFGILTTSHLLMAMFFFGWGPLAPMLRGDIRIDNAQLGFLVSAMYLAMVVVSVPSGFLVDRYGARRMLMLALSLVGSATCLLSASSSTPFLFAVAVLGGSGYGMINQITTKGLMYWFEPHRRATIMGIKQTGVTVGGSLIGLYIPFGAHLMGWQKAVLLLAFGILAMVPLSLLAYREMPETPIDAKTRPTGQGRTQQGLRALLLRPSIVALTVLFAMYAACQACVVAFLVIYAEETFRLSHMVAGSLLTVAMMAGTVSRILFGMVSDRLLHGERLAPMAMLAFIGVVGTLSLSLLGPSPPLGSLYVISVLLGTSLIGWNALAITLVAEIAGQEWVGSTIGIVFTIAWVGMVVAPPVFGSLVDGQGYDSGWRMLSLLIGLSCLGFATLARILREGS